MVIEKYQIFFNTTTEKGKNNETLPSKLFLFIQILCLFQALNPLSTLKFRVLHAVVQNIQNTPTSYK